MPAIEITHEQARALARGEDITIGARPPSPVVKRFVAIKKDTGDIYEYITHDGREQPWRRLRSTTSHFPAGYQSDTVFRFSRHSDLYTIVEIPA